jgi:hypothetical protein
MSSPSREAILAALDRTHETPPAAALRAADAHRASLTPPLIASILEAALHPEHFAAAPERQLPFYAMYLLAAWRERLAHPAILAFLRLPGEQALDLSGDIVTEDMDRILAQTAGGDPAGILTLVRDPRACIWCRNAALRALGLLHVWSDLPRATLVGHLREIVAAALAEGDLDDLTPADEANRYVSALLLAEVVCLALDYTLIELRDELLPLFDRGLIDESVTGDRADVAAAFARPPIGHRKSPLEDVVEAVSWWTSFRNENEFPAPDTPHDLPWLAPAREPLPPPADTVPQPYRAPLKVGRNDPCPCGSGKKYKKCCGS